MESNSGQRLSSEWKRQVYAVGNETQKTSVWSVWSDSWTHTTAGLITGNAAAPPACLSSGWSAVCRVAGEWAPASANMSASGKNILQLQTPPPAAFQFLLPSSAHLYHLVTTCTGDLANTEECVLPPAQGAPKRLVTSFFLSWTGSPFKPGGKCAGEAGEAGDGRRNFSSPSQARE